MANNFVNSPKLMQGLSYEEMARGVQQMNQLHQSVADADAKIAGQAGAVGANLDPNLDSKTYGIYKAYNDNLMNIASDLAKNGVTKSSLDAIRSAQASYAGTIGKIETAYKTKLQRAEELRQMQIKDPTYMSSWNPATMSTDVFYDNPMASGKGISGDQIRKTVAENAAAVAKETNFDKFRTILGGQAFERMKQAGMHSAADVQAALKNPNSHWGSIIYNSILNPVRQALGYEKWMTPEQLREAYNQERQGLNYLVGGVDAQLHANAEYLNPLQRKQMAQLEQQEAAAPPMNEETVTLAAGEELEKKKKEDIAAAKLEHYRFTQAYKRGLIDKHGNLTKKGYEERKKTPFEASTVRSTDEIGPHTQKFSNNGSKDSALLRDLGYTDKNYNVRGRTLAKNYANHAKIIKDFESNKSYSLPTFVIPYKDVDAAYNALSRHSGVAGLYNVSADWENKTFKKGNEKIDMPERKNVQGITSQIGNGGVRYAITMKDGTTQYVFAPVASRNAQNAAEASKVAHNLSSALKSGIDPMTGKQLTDSDIRAYNAAINNAYQVMNAGLIYNDQLQLGMNSTSTNYDWFDYGN